MNSALPAKTQLRQRRVPRYLFDASIQVSVFRDGLTTEHWGRTSKLSLNGLTATLGGDLYVGDVISVEFGVPVAPHVLKLRATVRYKVGLGYGVEFLVLDAQQRMALREVCARLANASPSFSRERK
jgi:hypothetical protein